VWSVIATILLVLSVIGNALLFGLLMLLAPLAMSGLSTGTVIEENTLQEGPATAKIAVIRVEGLLNGMMVENVAPMLRRAADDPHVRAVVLRVNSPGGELTASDELHHEIETFRASGKPIVTAMGSVAASGGYYLACATDYIVAEPTTITGSIGVIGEFFFVNTLMQDKLGVTPVTLKMGEQKDWPNTLMAKDLAPEQREYLMETLLRPGYERFVTVVAEGRSMEREKVLGLATGGIFMADEALQAELIDEVGYLEAALDTAKEMAKIKEVRVVEYQRPVTLRDLMGLGAKAQRALDLRESAAQLAAPRVLYLWKGL